MAAWEVYGAGGGEADRYGDEEIAENLHLILKQEAEIDKADQQRHGILKFQCLSPVI